MSFLLYNLTLKSSSKKTSKILKPLTIICKISLEKIFNISSKKLKTRYYIFNIFNLF